MAILLSILGWVAAILVGSIAAGMAIGRWLGDGPTGGHRRSRR